MTIEDFLGKVKVHTDNVHLVFDISPVTEELAELIFSETGISIHGFMVTIDNYGIRHALERHSDAQKEAAHGQVAITDEDLLLIPSIIFNPDRIIYDHRKKVDLTTKNEVFIFEKVENCYIYVVKEIRRVRKKGKLNRLVFQTMFKTKKRRTF
ncbi:MAG: hypothetical protein IT261_11740 [Saprospiraceae bacterium]|nr:hypothetical protein [Saprospiraceae bacterium]